MNPYPGLRPFDEADQDVFFGREEEIDQLLYRLAERRLMAVLGVSGCGKSSLIRAGLIPVLRSGLADPLSGAWRILTLFPGTAPLEALNQALGTRLDKRSHALHEWAKIQNPSEKILLLVDQFEEIFAYRKDTMSLDGGNSAALFVDFLLTAARDPGIPLYVVLTMRTDYLGDCPVFQGLAEALNDGQYLVPRLTRLHLQDAIERPAEFCTVTPQPALVQRLLTDSTEDADKLPVLQHLLKRLWEERNGGPLDLALYKNDKVGGWKHALERDAEAVLMRFPEEQEGVCRLFQALTDQGTGDKPVRRKQPMANLSAVTGITAGRLEKIVKSFADRDFLRLEGTSLNVVVELMHESVMWQWPKLKDWIDQEATLAKSLEFLKNSADKQQSVTGSALAQARNLSEQGRLDGLWPRRYLSDSELDAVKKWIGESEQREEAEKKRSQKELRQARRLLAIVGTAALICLVAGILAFSFYRRAQQKKLEADHDKGLAEAASAKAIAAQAGTEKALGLAKDNADLAQASQREAKAREFAAKGMAKLSDDPQQSLSLGISAVDATLRFKQPVFNVAEDLLHDAILSSPVRTLPGHKGAVNSVAFSPDGKRLAAASADHTVSVWDAANGDKLLTLQEHLDTVTSVAFSPDSKRLATASADHTIKLWDAAKGSKLRTLSLGSGFVNSVAFSRDGKLLASADDQKVKLWDATTGKELLTLKVKVCDEIIKPECLADYSSVSAVFSPDGKSLATVGADRTVKLWDPVSGRELHSPQTKSGNIRYIAVAFSPDGKRLAIAGSDKTVTLWDLANESELSSLQIHGGDILSVAFSVDSRRLAIAGSDKTVQLWDVASEDKKLLLIHRGHGDAVTSVAFSPDGNYLASGSKDKTVKLWDAAGGQELLSFRGQLGVVQRVALSPDGKLLAVAGTNHAVKLWNMISGQELRTLSGDWDSITSMSFSRDRGRLATASVDYSVKLWDAASGQELLTLPGHADTVICVAYSPDGKRLATASADRTVKLWDAGSGHEPLTLGGQAGVTSLAFSPDGKRIAGSADRKVILWDAATGQELLTLPDQSSVTGVAFSPDGNRLATVNRNRTAMLWDAIDGHNLLKLPDRFANSIAFSPDNRYIATGGSDKTVKLWDAASGRELLTLNGHSNVVTNVAFSPDSKRLATSSADRTVKLWDAASGRELLTLIGHADAITSLAFSPDGKRIATGSADRTVKLWDATSGKELLTLIGHSNVVTSVAFSHDGRRLATGGADHPVTVWDVASGRALHILRGHSNIVEGVAFSPDGKRLATVSADRSLMVWDATTGRELLTRQSGHSDTVTSVVFSPDGKRLSTASADGVVKVWDAVEGRELHSPERKLGGVYSLAFNPDGKHLAFSSANDTRLWDIVSGREVRAFGNHKSAKDLAFSPDGQRLATANPDGTIILWDVGGGDLLGLNGNLDPVSKVAFSSDGKRLATASADATAKVYTLDTEELLRLAKKRARDNQVVPGTIQAPH